MRIRSRSERRGAIGTPTSTAGERAAAPKVDGVFRTSFTAVEDDLRRADLDVLLGDVDRTANDLKRWRGRSQLTAYQRAVKSFLKAAMEQMYRVEHETRFDRRGARVSSVVVRAIDEHLEALTAEILKGEKSAIPLAARLDEIRGLLLDMYG